MFTCPKCRHACTPGSAFCPACGISLEAVAGSHDPLVGKVIGNKYRIEELLDAGGMGRVYLARHLVFDELHAVKMLHAQYADQEDFKKRFFTEANLTRKASLQTPHIVYIHDFGYEPEVGPYLAMEVLHGQPLSELIHEGGALQVSTVIRFLRIMIQVCEAIHFAHALGIIHRDLKPENIFLTRHEGKVDFVKIIDFGIAHPREGVIENYETLGQLVGTPAFMAPELIMTSEERRSKHWPLDQRVDIYALGISFYKLLVGEGPFETGGDGQSEVIWEVWRQHVEEEPLAPHLAAPEYRIPLAVSELIMQALAKDPAQRYASMQAFAEACRSVILELNPDATVLGGRSPHSNISIGGPVATRPNPKPQESSPATAPQAPDAEHLYHGFFASEVEGGTWNQGATLQDQKPESTAPTPAFAAPGDASQHPTASPHEIHKHAPATEEMAEKLGVADMTGELALEDMAEELGVAENTSALSLEGMTGELSLEDMAEELGLSDMTGKIALEDMADELGVAENTSALAIEDMTGELSLEDMAEELGVAENTSALAIEDLSLSPVAEQSTDTGPQDPQNALGQTPLTSKRSASAQNHENPNQTPPAQPTSQNPEDHAQSSHTGTASPTPEEHSPAPEVPEFAPFAEPTEKLFLGSTTPQSDKASEPFIASTEEVSLPGDNPATNEAPFASLPETSVLPQPLPSQETTLLRLQPPTYAKSAVTEQETSELMTGEAAEDDEEADLYVQPGGGLFVAGVLAFGLIALLGGGWLFFRGMKPSTPHRTRPGRTGPIVPLPAPRTRTQTPTTPHSQTPTTPRGPQQAPKKKHPTRPKVRHFETPRGCRPTRTPEQRVIRLFSHGISLSRLRIRVDGKRFKVRRRGCLRIPAQSRLLQIRYRYPRRYHRCSIPLTAQKISIAFDLIRARKPRPPNNDCSLR